MAAAVLPGVPSTGAVKVAKAAANVAKKAGDAIAATKAAKTVVNATKTVAKATKAAAQTVKKAVTVAKGTEKAGDIGKAVGTTVEAVTSSTTKKVVTETIENAGEAAVKADVIADTGKNLGAAADAVKSPAPTVVTETAQSVGEAAGKADGAVGVVTGNKSVVNTTGKTFESKYDIPTNDKGYTKSSLELGKRVHKEYKASDVDNIVRFKEYTLPSGKRVDYIDFETKIVYELKPYNPNQIRNGSRQLQNYLNEIESVYGSGWSSVLDTY